MSIGKQVDIYHAIADETRRRLLELLLERERPVQELVRHFSITIGGVSQHLKVLLESGLVARRKEGRHRYYRVQPDALREVHEWTGQYRRFWESSLDRLGQYLDEEGQ